MFKCLQTIGEITASYIIDNILLLYKFFAKKNLGILILLRHPV